MTRVQIAKLEPNKTRWDFVAHGAAYDREDAAAQTARLEARGCKVRLLPLRKGE